MKRLVTIALCAVSLSACMGRQPVPVATAQNFDDHLSCDQVRAEIDANNTKAVQLDNENRSAHNGNVATAVVGTVLFWPAYFALDTGTAERDEEAALRARNAHLTSLVTNRVCDRVGDAYASESAYGQTPITWNEWSVKALRTNPQHACKMPNGATLSLLDTDCAKAGGNILMPN